MSNFVFQRCQVQSDINRVYETRFNPNAVRFLFSLVVRTLS